MEIRAFRREDVGEVVDLWNRCLKGDKGDCPWYLEFTLLSEVRLEGIVADPNFDWDGAFVACDGERMVGFGRGVVKKVGAYEGEKLEDLPGYLEGLVVDPSFRRRGVGTRLLQHIESYVWENGKDALQISFHRSPIFGVSVLPETPEYRFLVGRGFEIEVSEFRLRLVFDAFRLREEILETREKLRREGIEITYYQDQHRDSFSRLMERYFSGWWYHSYRPNLERRERLPVLVALEGDRVVGFVGFVHVRENGRAGFSPGVDPEYRRRGIGKVLVNLWAQDVKEMGAVESIISTDTENYPAQRVYFGMGYRKLGEFCNILTKRL